MLSTFMVDTDFFSPDETAARERRCLFVGNYLNYQIGFCANGNCMEKKIDIAKNVKFRAGLLPAARSN